MTVGEWITRRTPQPPAALSERILGALGNDAELPVSRTADVCLAAATRSLDGMLSESRFTRDDALDLLALDALMTSAFEYASQSGGAQALDALAARGTERLGQLMTQRV